MSPDKTPPPPSWLDLILYLVVGMGGFFGASLLVGRIVNTDVVTLPISILAYVLNLIFFAGSVLVLGVARGKLSLREIGFIPPRIEWKWFFGAIAISLALLPLRGLVGVAVQYLAGGNMEGLQGRMDVIAPDGFTWLGFFVTLLGAGILAPISEELFFRGAIFTWFRGRYSFSIAMFASSLLFGLGHFDTVGVVASSFVLALVAAYVFEKSKTLWAPILMHITTNSVAILFIYAALAFAPDLVK
ncbi:MAG: CPBP family intramembrane metalloprotease [Anaerolineae bacterium]|nr:CPBP family intramembrane metalloprotease [Anaerolineae bacterium]